MPAAVLDRVAHLRGGVGDSTYETNVLTPIAGALVAIAVAVAPPGGAARPGPSAAQAWTPEPTATTSDAVMETPPRRALADGSTWQRRDRRLVIAAGVSGAVFGASAIAATVLGLEIRKSLDRCTTTMHSHCEETRDRVLRLKTPAIAVAGIVGASFVALLVSGIMLAVHRSRRPEIAGIGASRLVLSPSGLRLRF
ncbi:MAG TPA: hypothetical protein VFG69_09960 [Nannocystaceae bacterium]|nr:hypothetical protein [Nannocystaceae bacterium]